MKVANDTYDEPHHPRCPHSVGLVFEDCLCGDIWRDEQYGADYDHGGES